MQRIRIEDIYNNKLFEKYYEILVEENSKYNLTAITEKEEVYYKHFYDCAYLLNYIDLDNKVICDVGSGAGFPGIVLKIMCPSLKLFIIEPIGKRCNFLKMLVEKLELTNVVIINDRAENIKQYRNYFDYCFARAVSNLPMLCELCIPLVKVNGYFVALKGSNYQEEIDLAANALKELKSVVDNIYTYELKEYGTHSIVNINKKSKTIDKYPRPFAQIKKNPL